MGLIVGSARQDERGKYAGGQAGDQTGKEVATQSFYMHSQGWYVLRPKNINHANKIAQAMLDACANNNIGYDQNQRLGVITQLNKYGSLGRIGVATECDCSSLVRACVIQATGKDAGNFTTGNEATYLENSGLFEKRVSVSGSAMLYNGDILVTKTKGHTVIVVSGRSRGGTPASNTNHAVNCYLRAKTKKYGWQPEVANGNDYAGVNNDPIIGFMVRVDFGSIKYRCHIKGGGWLSWVTGYNASDHVNGYAGLTVNSKVIDAIQIYYYTPTGVKPYKEAIYKVNGYSWQHDTSTSNKQDGYAGLFGTPVTKIWTKVA